MRRKPRAGRRMPRAGRRKPSAGCRALEAVRRKSRAGSRVPETARRKMHAGSAAQESILSLICRIRMAIMLPEYQSLSLSVHVNFSAVLAVSWKRLLGHYARIAPAPKTGSRPPL